MAKFICKECRYRSESSGKKCPYCNKETLEQEKDAEELLEEVNKIMK